MALKPVPSIFVCILKPFFFASDEHSSIAPECTAEVKEIRRELMEDYKISPEIVHLCSDEIKDSCGADVHKEGKTIHCLMKLKMDARGDDTKKMSDGCLRAVSE